MGSDRAAGDERRTAPKPPSNRQNIGLSICCCIISVCLDARSGGGRAARDQRSPSARHDAMRFNFATFRDVSRRFRIGRSFQHASSVSRAVLSFVNV